MRSFSFFKPRDPFKNWSKELDKRVAFWARNFDSSFKLLLLGPAGAGKTTIMKQMKIIHFEGFSLEERQQKVKEIRSNLLESIRELTACITASGHQINWCDKENQNRLDFINGLNLDDQTYDIYAAKIYDYSKRILTDKGVEELFAKLSQLSVTHRSQYLLNRVDEIRNVNYIPNNDDILQSRRRTSDIQKLEFQVKLPVKSGPTIQQTFCLFDVGGQRGERRKWIQVFDGVSAVMFLIDSSSFDAIDEENGRNKLKETINLFHEVWTTRFLLNSNFVLLFNKQDILREKIERGHRIEDHFPEYKLYKLQPTGSRQQQRSHRHSSRHPSPSSPEVAAAAAAASSTRSSLSFAGSDKLSLFRTTSSRPAPRAAATKLASLDTSAGRPSLDGEGGDDGRPHSTAHTPATKRKSASLYLFGGSSKSSPAPAERKTLKAPPPTSCSAPSTPKPAPRSPAHRQQQQQVEGPAADQNRAPRASDFHDAAKLEGSGAESDGQPQQQTQTQEGEEAGEGSANHFAYLKARSFIRDKFLQVTRQVRHDFDQRKLSSPNLPVYNKGGAGASSGQSSASARSGKDALPKRNVCYHYTTATDTENIRDLFENLQRMVLKSTMKSSF